MSVLDAILTVYGEGAGVEVGETAGVGACVGVGAAVDEGSFLGEGVGAGVGAAVGEDAGAVVCVGLGNSVGVDVAVVVVGVGKPFEAHPTDTSTANVASPSKTNLE